MMSAISTHKPLSPSPAARSFQIGFYRHYKGGLYQALGVVNHSETLEEMVYYQRLDDGSLWVRPLTMFLEQVAVDGVTKPRFDYLGVSLK